jgi:hypothetical protein
MGALRLFLSTLWKRSPSSNSLSPMLGTVALYDDVAMVRLTVRTGRSRFHAAVGLFMALLLSGSHNLLEIQTEVVFGGDS